MCAVYRKVEKLMGSKSEIKTSMNMGLLEPALISSWKKSAFVGIHG
jgi:hypothetical protein